LVIAKSGGAATVDAAPRRGASFANNQAQVAGTAVSVNSGAKDAGTQRVILASDQTVVPVSDNAGSLTVDAPVGTPVFTRLSDGTAALTTTGGRLSVDASGVAVPITDNAGSLTVDNGGTFAVQDSQTIADNAGFTDGTSKIFPVGLIFDEVAGTALTENDVAAPRIDAKRATVTTLEDATTRGQRAAVSAAGALKVDNSAVTQPVSGTVSITANSAVNVAQVAGTTTDTNSGVKSAGTQRMVLATGPAAAHERVEGRRVRRHPAGVSLNESRGGWFPRPARTSTPAAAATGT
jgi:plasmid maintenance system antidote protein VapI